MKMSLRLTLMLLAILVLSPALPAHANVLDVDLSKPDVRLDVSFKGSDLLLFGAKDLSGDIIVVVRGPLKDTAVRLQERMAGIWVASNEVIFKDAPSYYAVASSKPLADLLPSDVLTSERIGTQHLGLEVISKPESVDQSSIQNYFNGLRRNMVAKSLYGKDTGLIELVGKQLFRTDLWFPANVSVGDYTVDTYMVVDKEIKVKHSTQLEVHKVGLEAKIFNFAHEHALIYGLLAVLIAVVSGWAANAVFKKRG